MLSAALTAWWMVLFLHKTMRADANAPAAGGINAVFKGNSLDSGLGTARSNLAAAEPVDGSSSAGGGDEANIHSSYIDVLNENGKQMGKTGRDNWVHLEAELP